MACCYSRQKELMFWQSYGKLQSHDSIVLLPVFFCYASAVWLSQLHCRAHGFRREMTSLKHIDIVAILYNKNICKNICMLFYFIRFCLMSTIYVLIVVTFVVHIIKGVMPQIVMVIKCYFE